MSHRISDMRAFLEKVGAQSPTYLLNHLAYMAVKAGNEYPLPILSIGIQHPRDVDFQDVPEKYTRTVQAFRRFWGDYVESPGIDKAVPVDLSGGEIYYPAEGAPASPTLPITLHESLRPFMAAAYTISRDAYAVPIYFIIRKPLRQGLFSLKRLTESSHLSAVVFCNNTMYSFGLGEGFERLGKTPEMDCVGSCARRIDPTLNPYMMFEGAFATPDDTPFLRTTGGTFYNFDIIDAGFFTTAHAQRLLKFVVPPKSPKAVYSPEKYQIQVSFERDKFDGGYVFPTIKINNYGLHYKLCARRKTNTAFNCATFIETIFPNRIRCTGWLSDISAPKNCVRLGSGLNYQHISGLLDLLEGRPIDEYLLDDMNSAFAAPRSSVGSAGTPVRSIRINSAAAAAPVTRKRRGSLAAAAAIKSVEGRTSGRGSGTRRR